MTNLEDRFPVMWQWVKEQGTIQLGSDEFSDSFLQAFDPGGLCWDSGEQGFDSLEAALAALELGLTEYCRERGLFQAPSSEDSALFNQRLAVDSSMLTAIEYDPQTQTLQAWFTSGKHWLYHGVPPSVFKELHGAGSVGGYMRDFIIDCYRDEQVRSKRR